MSCAHPRHPSAFDLATFSVSTRDEAMYYLGCEVMCFFAQPEAKLSSSGSRCVDAATSSANVRSPEARTTRTRSSET